jgi:hypothetical protein
MTEQAIGSANILRIFTSCLFRENIFVVFKIFSSCLLREIEKCRWPARQLLDTPDFGGQVLDKRAQSAELIVFGSVNCESLQSKSCCAPRYDKKQELWALELIVPLGIAYNLLACSMRRLPL